MRTKYNHPVADPGGFYPDPTYEKKKTCSGSDLREKIRSGSDPRKKTRIQIIFTFLSVDIKVNIIVISKLYIISLW